jgi:hypothetical protein
MLNRSENSRISAHQLPPCLLFWLHVMALIKLFLLHLDLKLRIVPEQRVLTLRPLAIETLSRRLETLGMAEPLFLKHSVLLQRTWSS